LYCSSQKKCFQITLDRFDLDNIETGLLVVELVELFVDTGDHLSLDSKVELWLFLVQVWKLLVEDNEDHCFL